MVRPPVHRSWSGKASARSTRRRSLQGRSRLEAEDGSRPLRHLVRTVQPGTEGAPDQILECVGGQPRLDWTTRQPVLQVGASGERWLDPRGHGRIVLLLRQEEPEEVGAVRAEAEAGRRRSGRGARPGCGGSPGGRTEGARGAGMPGRAGSPRSGTELPVSHISPPLSVQEHAVTACPQLLEQGIDASCRWASPEGPGISRSNGTAHRGLRGGRAR